MKHQLLKPLHLLFGLVLVFFLLIKPLKNGLFQRSSFETSQVERRREYYALELGKIYRNRFGIYYFDLLRPLWVKYLSYLGSLLRIENYFFK